jgi:hypothetical protein
MPSYTLTNNASDIDSALSRVVAAETVPSTGSQNMVTSGGVKNYVDTVIAGVGVDTSAIEADVLALQTSKTAGAVVTRTSEFSVNSESYQTIPLTVSRQNDFLSANGNNITITAGHYLMWHKFEWKSQGSGYPAWYRPQINIDVLSGNSNFFGSMANPFFPEAGNPNWQHEVRLTAFYNYVSSDTTFRMRLRDDPEYGTNTQYIRNLSWLFLKI